MVGAAALLAIFLALFVFLIKTNQRQADEVAMSREEIARLAEQQKLFSDWYNLYQRDIDDLSHNWQRYHHTIEAFKEDNISLSSCHERLSELAEEEGKLVERINARKIPDNLDPFLAEETRQLNAKTLAYAAAQYRAIALSRAAADPQSVRSDIQAEQSRLIQEIMIKESPAGLFTAQEVYAIREYLAMPEDATHD